jgi:hypothetical protein
MLRWLCRCRASIVLTPKLVAVAHQVCPYSNATRNNLDEDHRRLIGFKLSFRVGPKGPDPES